MTSVYQRARTGTKAWIGWLDYPGSQQDAWFADMRVASGTVLLLRGGSGYGPHHDRPRVFYTGAGAVLAQAPYAARLAWRRMQHQPSLT